MTFEEVAIRLLGTLRDTLAAAVIQGLGAPVTIARTVTVPANGTADVTVTPGLDMAVRFIDLQVDNALCFPVNGTLNNQVFFRLQGTQGAPGGAPVNPDAVQGYLRRPVIGQNVAFTMTLVNTDGAPHQATVYLQGYTLGLTG